MRFTQGKNNIKNVNGNDASKRERFLVIFKAIFNIISHFS